MDPAVEIALWINRRLPRRSLERRASDEAYASWEYESGRASFAEHFGADRLRGNVVLDAACGPGGKTAWYAEAAATVIGVDLDIAHLARARGYGVARGVASRQRFVAADVQRLPLRDGRLDAVTANDALEHFADPAAALAELARIVRPGGRLYVTFPPFPSANGAHLYDYVRIPWCQLLLGRRALWEVVRRAVLETERERGGADADARAERIAREQWEFFENALNGITVRGFLAMLGREPRLRARSIRFEPPRFRWLRPLAALPGLREVLTATLIAELERV
jgi:SAM-dependent methyltransferase